MIRPPPNSPLFPSTPLFRSHDEGDVHPPAIGLHVGQIGDPQAIGSGGSELAGDQVPRSVTGFVPDRRPDTRLAPDHASDRKSTRLNSSHANISYAVFCLKKK